MIPIQLANWVNAAALCELGQVIVAANDHLFPATKKTLLCQERLLSQIAVRTDDRVFAAHLRIEADLGARATPPSRKGPHAGQPNAHQLSA